MAAAVIKPVDFDPADDSSRDRLLQALESCATEGEIAQVLFTSLSPVFGYQVVTLHVLEGDGSYHAIAVDAGILQHRVRGLLSRSVTKGLYENGVTAVVRPDAGLRRSRGTGRGQEPHLLLWVPLSHRGEVFASVLYEASQERPVPPRELSLLEDVHRDLGVLVANAYLHETTRDQAARLTALNDVARVLAPTREMDQILPALRGALRRVLAIEAVELTPWRYGTAELRIERSETSATVYVPVRDESEVKAALALRVTALDPHEESLVEFLEGVADQVALALRNAEARAAELAHRRRLEVVSAAGRRLASTLDRWSIMRTLREELAGRLQFDIFIVATVRDTDTGPVAEGFAYDSGGEQWLPSVPLASAGPARTAYESGRTVFIGRAPWAEAVDRAHPEEETWVMREGAAIFVTRPAGEPQAARSVAWVPVEVGKGRGALLSIQSYAPGAFDEADVRLLEDLAPYVGLALANADHFEATRAERRRVEALHSLQLGVSAAASPEDVARAALEGVRLFLPGDAVKVHLRGSAGAFTPYELGPDGELVTPAGGRGRRAGRHSFRAPRGPGEVWLPLDAGARPLGALSARRPGRFSQVEREFLEAAAPLIGVALARLELTESKDLMLRAIGHEIRSPAAAMTATLASLMQWGEELDAARRELLLGEAYGMSERLLALVEAQLLIAKLELGGFEPQPQEVSLPDLLADVLGVLSHRYEGAADVEVELPDALPPALCEAVHLQQVLTNLVGNAFEHGRPPVRVRARLRSGFIELSVTDSGPGPSPDVAAELFEKRGRTSRTRGGLGLGLYLCRLVVERSFRGRIWVHRLPRGAAFKFTVPRAV